MNMFKWILVIPFAIFGWALVDFVLPFLFNFILYIGSLIRLSPIAEFFFTPPAAYRIIIFSSFSVAVFAGVYIAPTHKILVAAIISILFISLRLAMTISILKGSHSFTEDSPQEYIIGTAVAFLGVVFSFTYIFRNSKLRSQITE